MPLRRKAMRGRDEGSDIEDGKERAHRGLYARERPRRAFRNSRGRAHRGSLASRKRSALVINYELALIVNFTSAPSTRRNVPRTPFV